jgi:hypothetical protein
LCGLGRSSARIRFTTAGVLPDSPVPRPTVVFPLPTSVSWPPSSMDLGLARSCSLGAGFDFMVLRREPASPCLFAKSPKARRLAGLDLVPALGLCGRRI